MILEDFSDLLGDRSEPLHGGDRAPQAASLPYISKFNYIKRHREILRHQAPRYKTFLITQLHTDGKIHCSDISKFVD